VVRVAGFTRDVTSQVCQRRSLERKNERLEAFAGVVSHDLRNPLTVARGNLERAREERDSEALETVARAHDRMAAMVDDLLTLARYGDDVSDTDPVDVADALGSCWETVDTEGARIDVDPPGVVSADGGRLKQLLENVLRNAVEHGAADSQGGARAGESGDDAGPAVRVEVGPLDDGFYVADDGTGIPAADRAAVFETGYSTDERGTGFGLAIVERIADAHGWRVDVAESERGGARFEFTDVEFVEE
jgi:signal transduction histidine kinase